MKQLKLQFKTKDAFEIKGSARNFYISCTLDNTEFFITRTRCGGVTINITTNKNLSASFKTEADANECLQTLKYFYLMHNERNQYVYACRCKHWHFVEQNGGNPCVNDPYRTGIQNYSNLFEAMKAAYGEIK